MAVAVDVNSREVVVRVTGWDALWAMSRAFAIPLPQVRNAVALRRDELGSRPTLRMPGTALPGVVKAGRYVWRDHSEFWATRWPARMLVVTCVPGSRYDRVVLEVDDPDRDAAAILAALR